MDFYVMDFEEGMLLSDLLERREQQGRPLVQDEILYLLNPLLKGLAHVHDHNVLHRDIKPDTIYIRRSDEQAVLLDFGAAKNEFCEDHMSDLAGPRTSCYAATEEVLMDGDIGPWTDIYAIGGILYRTLTGNRPPEVEKRVMASVRGRPDPLKLDAIETDGDFTPGYVDLIRACMSLTKEDRIQSVVDLLTRIDGPDGEHTAGSESVWKHPASSERQCTADTGRSSNRSGSDRANPDIEVLMEQIFGVEHGKVPRAIVDIEPESAASELVDDSAVMTSATRDASGAPPPTSIRRKRSWITAMALIVLMAGASAAYWHYTA
jgi:serine/threonine protein kinase